ncbi:hypothetical protein SCUP234_06627 [Seiridium cupressi]
MAPVVSPRRVARALAASELDSRTSPLRSIPRQSQPSAFSPLSLRGTTARLSPRLADNVDIVPETYGAPSGPDAGTVVGIVLGSVAGFLLILWLIYSVTNLGNSNVAVVETASVGEGSVVTRKSRKHRRRRSHSARPRETVEVRRTERVVPVPVATERIVVEENVRSRSRGAPPPPMPPPAPRVVHDDDEDEVVVIEENTPPRRRESRQQKRRNSRRSSERRSSGYRDVDPYRYAGGDASIRSVSRRRSPSRGR